ncbi:MAG: hypothetical protein KatS3mg104_1285 [Phycisphaerae bacterium]|nr:MAG: hypothetical protein KatS3mg104_1285 [Phycisphaerae bacterium]
MCNSAQRLLGCMVVLQVLILGSLWSGHTLPRAEAQIPDPGAQRERQLDELRALNSKMDKLLDLLESGKLQVNVTMSEKK